jgi:hypothetical protein
LTLVRTAGCHFCEDAHEAVAALIEEGFALRLEVVDATSDAGIDLVALHRPALYPLVLVDGEYFSAGRLPRRKLQALLNTRGPAPVEAASRG